MDNVLLLTRGKPLTWINLFTSMFSSEELYTGVYQPEGENEKIMGQVYQSPKLPSANLNFILQPEHSDPGDMICLLDGLINEVGQRGAKQLVAELPTDSDYFPLFRRVGFSVLAKQQIYHWDSNQDIDPPLEHHWRIWACEDVSAMKSLYLDIVPALIQPIEPMTRREMLGLVYYDEGGALQAYADLVYGPAGAWVLPFVHPQIKADISDLMLQLVCDLPDLNGRPVYIVARSYQPWLDQALANLSLPSGKEQALMVRYLALRQRVQAEYAFPSIENGKAEPTVPLAPIKRHTE
jgi:hypothetical protein